MDNPIMKVGRVVEVSGSRVIGELDGTVEDLYRTYKSRRYNVGQIGSIVRINAGDMLVFGMVTALRMTETLPARGSLASSEASPDAKWLEIELFGEAIRTGVGEGDFEFQRGVATYPLPGQNISVASTDELQRIFHNSSESGIHVGSLSQASSLQVHLLMDDLIGKHFAVLGNTGAGKSCAVTVILNAMLNLAPKAHILLLDFHDEYSRAFGDSAETISYAEISLPHWVLNFEEAIDLFIGRSEQLASAQTRILKRAMIEARKKTPPSDIPVDSITVDTPVPYEVTELIDRIESYKPSQASKQDSYNKIVDNIKGLQEDSRLSFLFAPREGNTDQLVELLQRILRVPVGGRPLSIIDLSGVPSDVVNVVVSVLCRVAFDFAMWGLSPVKVPILVVCEEVHRYAPSEDDATFHTATRGLARIAKEGRKYGVGLGLISQRPSELSESILSQCNTVVALRMSNANDQRIVERFLPDSIQGLANSLSTLRNQEALVVGEGSSVPVRLRFKDLAEEDRPQSANVAFSEKWKNEEVDGAYVEEVVKRWRDPQGICNSAANANNVTDAKLQYGE